MKVEGKIVVVTGAASGIGRALAERFARDGAEKVVCADLDAKGVQAVAESLGGRGIARAVDVSEETQVRDLVEFAEHDAGPVDLFCSNAGISAKGGPELGDEVWERMWRINVMAHVWAARHIVPKMIARGGGYLLNTASAAGLLSQIGSAPYAVTKHAAVGLAEWLQLTYGDQGIKVSVLCPQGVRTEMTRGGEGNVAAKDGMLEPEEAAEACVRTLEAESFLVLPHPQVLDYMRNKTADYDRWLGGMRKLNRIYEG